LPVHGRGAVQALASGRGPGEDARDAERVAQLALLGQIMPVRVPVWACEAAREDVRTDLMRAAVNANRKRGQ
jgi:hypothetical protein